MAETVELPVDEVVAHMAGSQLFALLDLATLRRLAPLFQAVRYGSLATLSRQGDTDATLWLVADGMVALEQARPDGTSRTVKLLDYGSALGQHGVFAGLPRETTAVTVDPTLLLHADGATLWDALRAEPETLDKLVLPDDVRARMELTPADEAVAGEVAVATYRRHWIALARGLMFPAIALVVGLPLALATAPRLPSAVTILLLAALGLGIPLVLVLWAFLDWRLDYLMVTNRRLIHVDRMPLISERRREVPLGRIQDIRVATPNLVARALGYGLLSIQTAGTTGTLTFTPVSSPEDIRLVVMDQVSRVLEQTQRERQAQIAERLKAALGLTAAAAHLAPQEPAGPPPGTDHTRAGLLAFLLPWLTYFLPRLREEGPDGTITWRKHWWVLVKTSILWLVAGAALFALFLASAGGWLPVPWWAGSLGWLIVAAGLWWQYANWRNDFYQLSHSHVVDVDQLPLGLYRERRQAALAQIQDIRYDVPNPLAVLLNYGNLLIETAAETGGFTFEYIHDPASVQQEIFARIEQHRAAAQAQVEARQADELARWLREYHELVGEEEMNRRGAEGAQSSQI
jgi:uncharacterized membrane protein YdbT with pleckstrin-like domain